MSGSHVEESKENTTEPSTRAMLEEEFRGVFGGITPVTTAWAGLTFICHRQWPGSSASATR
jgi:hypothetical protein